MPVFVGDKFIQGAYLNGKQYDTAYIGDNKVGFKTPPGEAIYTTPGTYQWVCPAGVFFVSAVCVGGGANGFSGAYNGANGGGGGGLGWKNNIAVTPGQSYTVQVGISGGDSYFINNTTVKGGGGSSINGGDYVGDGGGNGGTGGVAGTSKYEGGGGGAGGYSGDGGNGADGNGNAAQPGSGGSGSGGYYVKASDGSCKFSGAGGGVGLFGEGGITRGDGYYTSVDDSKGGSGGQSGFGYIIVDGVGIPPLYGNIGGGGSSYGHYTSYYTQANQGGEGAVRIIWGTGIGFPSQSTSYVIPENYIFTQDFSTNWQPYFWDFKTRRTGADNGPYEIINDTALGKDVMRIHEGGNLTKTNKSFGVTLFTPYTKLSNTVLTINIKANSNYNGRGRIYVDGVFKINVYSSTTYSDYNIPITGAGVHEVYIEVQQSNSGGAYYDFSALFLNTILMQIS